MTTDTAVVVHELLALSRIVESKTNPRRTFADMKDLVESVRSLGVLQPILVRPTDKGFEVVFGARRFRAAKEAGLELVPAMIREMTDNEVLEAQLVENLHRADVHPLEEADGYDALMHATGQGVEEIAAKVGKSKAYVYARLKYRALTKKPREMFLAGALDASKALLVARIPNKDLQEQAATAIAPLAYRDAAAYVQQNFMLHLAKAPFDTKDATLTKAGACGPCPLRTGNAPDLFGDVGNADVCTGPKCWAEKVKADFARKAAAAKEKGVEVLDEKQSRIVFPYDNDPDRVAYNSKFVTLDDQAPYETDSLQRTWRKILEDAAPEPAVLAQDRAGVTREMYRVERLEEIAREEGLLKKPERSSMSSYGGSSRTTKKQRDQSAIAKAASELLLADMVAKAEKIVGSTLDGPPTGLLRTCLERLTHVSWHDAVTHVVKRRGLEVQKNCRAEDAIESAIADMSGAQAVGLLVELVAMRHVSYSWARDGKVPGQIAELAKAMKFDPAKYVKAAKGAKAAKKKTKPAKAKTKKKAKAAAATVTAKRVKGRWSKMTTQERKERIQKMLAGKNLGTKTES